MSLQRRKNVLLTPIAIPVAVILELKDDKGNKIRIEDSDEFIETLEEADRGDFKYHLMRYVSGRGEKVITFPITLVNGEKQSLKVEYMTPSETVTFLEEFGIDAEESLLIFKGKRSKEKENDK